MENEQIANIPEEKFTLVQRDESIFDTKFETKPIGYFKDAWLRFRKNKPSVVAFVILVLIILFAIFVPVVSRYDMSYNDPYYSYALPKISFMEGTGVWDGTEVKVFSEAQYQNAKLQPNYVVKVIKEFETYVNGTTVRKYKCRVDSYALGYQYITSSNAKQIKDIRDYEAEHDIQILYPMVDTSNYPVDRAMNANYYYEIEDNLPIYDDEGNLKTCYLTDADGELVYFLDQGGGTFKIRVMYEEYYKMMNGGKKACFIFGANNQGKDILIRLSTGARLSLSLGVIVAAINIAIGICYGAIEGYYGGVTDLIMERVSDILAEIPFVIVTSLFKMYLVDQNLVGMIPTLIFAFVLTGWIGTASRVRMQFYRYKGQEYVLAARTLGAKDGRLIFRHILPNAIGTIITSCILMIPSVIFSESSLTYLGIVDLENSNITSVGTLLSDGQSALQYGYPHILLFPALFIAILMISFNQFGKGLRDAFNPSLRGVEE